MRDTTHNADAEHRNGRLGALADRAANGLPLFGDATVPDPDPDPDLPDLPARPPGQRGPSEGTCKQDIIAVLKAANGLLAAITIHERLVAAGHPHKPRTVRKHLLALRELGMVTMGDGDTYKLRQPADRGSTQRSASPPPTRPTPSEPGRRSAEPPARGPEMAGPPVVASDLERVIAGQDRIERILVDLASRVQALEERPAVAPPAVPVNEPPALLPPAEDAELARLERIDRQIRWVNRRVRNLLERPVYFPVVMSGVAPPVTAEPPAPPQARHSDDYRSVFWFGRDYKFTVDQATAIERLWVAWQSGRPEVPEAELLADTGTRRLDELFRDRDGRLHKAWEVMIVHGAKPGVYLLKKPKSDR